MFLLDSSTKILILESLHTDLKQSMFKLLCCEHVYFFHKLIESHPGLNKFI